MLKKSYKKMNDREEAIKCAGLLSFAPHIVSIPGRALIGWCSLSSQIIGYQFHRPVIMISVKINCVQPQSTQPSTGSTHIFADYVTEINGCAKLGLYYISLSFHFVFPLSPMHP